MAKVFKKNAKKMQQKKCVKFCKFVRVYAK